MKAWPYPRWARKARKVERVPQEVVDDALGRLAALLD